jgi:UDP-glucose 4-epimerase
MSFIRADVADRDALEAVFESFPIDRVIHFAGFKAVGESVAKPIEYYGNNIGNTIALIDTMRAYGCKDIIFSSSATVYGDPDALPLTEQSPKKFCTNPYGWTKWMIEQILMDTAKADPEWNVVLLRYFNPIGAHESGLIGEDPNGIPNNLVPYIAQVAVGKLEKLHVYGDDYPTADGTGVRDYIHVVDLALGHVAALKKLGTNCGLFICNLGTGNGYSVLDVLHAYEKACGKTLPYVIDPRRPGDIAECYAEPKKAFEEMGWKAERGIEEMCASSWKWQSSNPNGYNA